MTRSRHTARRGKSRNTEKGGYDNNAQDKTLPYDTIVKENALFEKYYRQLNLIDANEFDEFLQLLKKPLPITFRITSYKSYAKEVLSLLKEKHFKYLDEITKGDESEKVLEASANKGASLLQSNDSNNTEKIYKCLEWYPNELAWQVELSRQDVRKNVHFEEFKQFLIHNTENGNLNRQEAVSMIPPLVLDVQPHHKILDMCAAPGSKTAQLIEMLHNDKSNPTPSGFVIANELENKRCYLLMHQLKRLESPNFMIINQDASCIPNFRVKVEGKEETFSNIMYDRILADVPCSGDGTFRKNIDVWSKWNFSHACNLHGIQSRIARRAIELLQHGGQMVYSTCSLNPVENEAVVYNLLLKFKGQLELVDARDKLPGLKTLKGLLTWNLMSKTGEIYNKIEEVKPEFVNLMRPYMFPPELSVAKELNLDRCIRVLPHHQNTGGFFIAVIRKIAPILNVDIDKEFLSTEVKPKKTDGPPEADMSRVMKAPPAKRVKHMYEENPFQFNDAENQLLGDWTRIKEFFQISEDFPLSQLMTRNKKNENVRNVYFVSKEIRELTLNNGDRFKFINMGVPLFSKAEIKASNCIELRISQESIDIVVKYFKRRIVLIKERSDLIKILSESMPSLNELSEDIQKQIAEQCQEQAGSFILTTKLVETGVNSNLTPVSFTAWLGKTTLRPLINNQARSFFLTIFGVDQAFISEACNKIKMEDKLNSIKSLKLNPMYKGEKEGETEPNIEENKNEKLPSDEEKEEDLDGLVGEKELNEDL